MAVVVDVIHVSAGHHDVIIVAQMIGEDVRWLILFWYYDKLMSFEEISELIVTPMHHGCARTVKNIVDRFEETGQVRMLVLNACLWLMTRDRRRWTGVDFQVAGSTARRPDTGHIDVVHRPVLYMIIEQDPWLYLDEIVKRLNEHPMVAGRVYSMAAIFRQLAIDKFSLTKMRKFASEQDERKRVVYWQAMNAELWFPGQLIFIDETSKDGRTLRRSHGRAHKGTRIVRRETILRGRRFSILGVLSIGGFVDWHMVEKGYSAEEFLYAFEHHVLPHLNPYPMHNSIVVRGTAG